MSVMAKKGTKGGKGKPRSSPPPPPNVSKAIAGKRKEVALRRSAVRLAARVVVIGLVAWAAFTQLFGLCSVRGEDMYPRLRDGDLVLTYRLKKDFTYGDVVAYREGERQRFGRVVATGGDQVSFSQSGMLLVNGNARQEEVFMPTTAEGRAVTFPKTLASQEVFILGDNRQQAVDCRDFGPVHRDMVEGAVIAVLRQRGI